MNFRAKTVKESIVETVHIIRPSDLNDAGRLFGGVLMQWIDEVAALVAKRHSQMNVTTASVDNLQFLHGAFQRDVIVIIDVYKRQQEHRFQSAIRTVFFCVCVATSVYYIFLACLWIFLHMIVKRFKIGIL